MRIGILTQPLITNYGGLLQAYALQQVLCRMGHEVLTIDWRSEFTYKSKFHQMKSWLGRLKLRYVDNILVPTAFYPLPSEKQNTIIERNTRAFVAERIKRTRQISCLDELKDIDDEYKFDAYVVGSDQVWNAKLARWTFLGFLSRSDVKRISYAASFGYADWQMNDEQTKDCAALAKLFDYLSVREYSAVDLCRDFLGVEAKHVLDPTMLLSKEDYLSVINKKDEENVLFSYILDNTTEKTTIVNSIAKQLDLDIRTCMPEEEFVRGVTTDMEKCVFPSVDQWINGFNNASFVVTDSFHGTVFSILFNKPFIAVGNKRRGMTRFESLLKMFDLDNRLVDNLADAQKVMDYPIDYDKVKTILNMKRENSFSFLKASVLE